MFNEFRKIQKKKITKNETKKYFCLENAKKIAQHFIISCHGYFRKVNLISSKFKKKGANH